MQARTLVTLITMIVGLTLAVVSYFWLATPLGQPTSEWFSNPRLDYAAALFVLGVVLTFSSAIVYELFPSKE